MGSSSSSSVATFSLSNLSYIKSGKRKNNEKEIISSILAPSSSTLTFSRKISPSNQTNNNSSSSKYKTNSRDTKQNVNQEDNDSHATNVQRKNSKRQNQSPKKDITTLLDEEITKSNTSDEYDNHILPLIIGDTVHILEENGEGKFLLIYNP